MLDLGSEYKLVKSEEQSVDFWFLAYRKVLENGLVNEYEGANITVARKDNSIAFLTTFDMPANTLKAEISEEQALEKAQPIIEKLVGKVNKVELKYVQPNFFWEKQELEPATFIRLAYQIQFNENYFVDIDAVTGEIIGGDEFMAAGGAFGVTNVSDASARYTLGVNGLRTLGYSVTGNYTNDYQLKEDIMSFLQRSDAYAFYFTGHGSTSSIGNQGVSWSLSRSTIASYGGNWDFVFLLACSTGTNTWANSFNIYSSSSNKAYIGFTGSIVSSDAGRYARNFWPQVGNSRLYNGAVYAQNQVYLPLYFCGDKYYWGWSR
jgi:hypothetical protein